jgi:hypothetical protein
MSKKLVLESTANVKINTGSYETIDVSKSIRVEVEYETMEELEKKSKSVDSVLAKLVKAEAETILKETGRTRVHQNKEVELWQGPPSVPNLNG